MAGKKGECPLQFYLKCEGLGERPLPLLCISPTIFQIGPLKNQVEENPDLGLEELPGLPVFSCMQMKCIFLTGGPKLTAHQSPRESRLPPWLQPACPSTYHCAQSACTAGPGTAPPASASRFSALLEAGRGGFGRR